MASLLSNLLKAAGIEDEKEFFRRVTGLSTTNHPPSRFSNGQSTGNGDNRDWNSLAGGAAQPDSGYMADTGEGISMEGNAVRSGTIKVPTPHPDDLHHPIYGAEIGGGIEGLLELNHENVLKGIVWSEILGAPKARKRRV